MKTLIKTSTNPFGEEVTKWESTKHPDNPNFMQTVFWTVWVKPDGRTLVAYKLNYNDQPKFIYHLTKDQAIEIYS